MSPSLCVLHLPMPGIMNTLCASLARCTSLRHSKTHVNKRIAYFALPRLSFPCPTQTIPPNNSSPCCVQVCSTCVCTCFFNHHQSHSVPQTDHQFTASKHQRPNTAHVSLTIQCIVAIIAIGAAATRSCSWCVQCHVKTPYGHVVCYKLPCPTNYLIHHAVLPCSDHDQGKMAPTVSAPSHRPQQALASS